VCSATYYYINKKKKQEKEKENESFNTRDKKIHMKPSNSSKQYRVSQDMSMTGREHDSSLGGKREKE